MDITLPCPPFGSLLEAILGLRPTKIPFQILKKNNDFGIDFGIDFRSIVEWSWRGLAGVLEPMLASKWHQKSNKEAIIFVIDLFIDF